MTSDKMMKFIEHDAQLKRAYRDEPVFREQIDYLSNLKSISLRSLLNCIKHLSRRCRISEENNDILSCAIPERLEDKTWD